VKLLCSPAIGILYQKLSFRVVTILGGVFMSVGLLLTGFATSFVMLFWGYGVLVGIGSNMGIMSSLVILTQYFLLKRGVAIAFTFCGNGISALVFPPLVTWSFKLFGYTQTLVIMACIMLQTLVLGALFRPQTFRAAPDQPPDLEPTSKCKSLTRKTGLNLLARPMVLFTLVTIASLQCLVSLGQIFVSGLAIERAGMSATEIATALSIAAISEFSKLPVGFCFDSNRLRPKRTYLFCAFAILMGLLAIALAFTRTTVTFTVVFAVYVFFAMGAHSQYVTIIGDRVAMEEMPNAIVLCRTLMGIVLLVVPLAIGRIKDVYDSFQLGFILYSSVHTVIVALYLVAYHWWRTRQNNTLPTRQ
jgi:OFA family oxalate/formate antiporter-like MFS transporter